MSLPLRVNPAALSMVEPLQIPGMHAACCTTLRSLCTFQHSAEIPPTLPSDQSSLRGVSRLCSRGPWHVDWQEKKRREASAKHGHFLLGNLISRELPTSC